MEICGDGFWKIFRSIVEESFWNARPEPGEAIAWGRKRLLFTEKPGRWEVIGQNFPEIDSKINGSVVNCLGFDCFYGCP